MEDEYMFFASFFNVRVILIITFLQVINIFLMPGLSAKDDKMVANKNKLACWSFDNDTPQKLKSTGQRQIDIVAKHKKGPSNIFISGVKGKALSLSSKHSCQFQSTKPLNLQPPYTICFWLKPARQQFSDIVGNKASSIKSGFRIRIEGGKLRLSWGDGDKNYTVVTTKSCIPPRQWTHIAITDDDDYISIFINGKLEQKFEKQGDIKNSKRNITIMNYSANPNIYPFIGALDELCFFNRILTPDELKSLQ
jgi:hypothetical protein